MLLGARQSLWRGGKLSARSYEQSGLVAQWDGIENVGLGLPHDPNSEIWKDLRGDYDLTINSPRGVWGETYLEGTNVNNDTAAFCDNSPNIKIIEVVYKRNINNGQGIVVLYLNRGPHAVATIPRRGAWQIGDHYKYYDIPIDDSPLSVSINYDQNVAYIMGEKEMPTGDYSLWGSARHTISLMSRDNDSYSLYGQIYSIRFYNKNLTETQILKNYQIDKKRFGI